MRPFTYERARSPAEAAAAAARNTGAKFIAGGTNLLDLMKLQIEAPTHLLDVNGLGLDRIRELVFRLGFAAIVSEGRGTAAEVTTMFSDEAAPVQAAWLEVIDRMVALHRTTA